MYFVVTTEWGWEINYAGTQNMIASITIEGLIDADIVQGPFDL